MLLVLPKTKEWLLRYKIHFTMCFWGPELGYIRSSLTGYVIIDLIINLALNKKIIINYIIKRVIFKVINITITENIILDSFI
jgi:hypothetical protein